MDAITSLFVPIHKEGHKFILIFALATVLAYYFLGPFAGWVGIVLTSWCVYFFRDPDRLTPTREGLVISPADGVVNLIMQAAPPAELGMGEETRTRISVFMNVFNCHVNRSPIAGKVLATAYRPGLFLNADLDKASDDNERFSMIVETSKGQTFGVVQIAGLVARRIISYSEEGQTLETGERFGIIRFGSRVDIYLPDGVVPLVSVGQKTIAGETVIADTESNEPAREAAIR